MVKVGQRVKVKSANGLFVTEGTVTAILPDGRFRFKNTANFESTVSESKIVPMSTATGEVGGHSKHQDADEAAKKGGGKAYIRAWAREKTKG